MTIRAYSLFGIVFIGTGTQVICDPFHQGTNKDKDQIKDNCLSNNHKHHCSFIRHSNSWSLFQCHCSWFDQWFLDVGYKRQQFSEALFGQCYCHSDLCGQPLNKFGFCWQAPLIPIMLCDNQKKSWNYHFEPSLSTKNNLLSYPSRHINFS